VNPTVTVHFCNKKHPISEKFRVNNASFIGNQNAKYQINQSKQTVVTAALVQ